MFYRGQRGERLIVAGLKELLIFIYLFIYQKYRKVNAMGDTKKEILLSFYHCPKKILIKLRTTNVIERAFRDVRRRTRRMSCFNNV